MNKTFPSFLPKSGTKETSQGSEFYSFSFSQWRELFKKNPWNKLEMCLKTDKGNAKLNSWCERKGTMKASRWDTFGENFNFTVSFLTCLLYFFHRYALWNAWKALYYFLFSFSFYYVVYIHFFYLPSDVEAVPIFLVLFLTPNCAQQYLPLNSFFHLFHFSYFLHPSSSFTS